MKRVFFHSLVSFSLFCIRWKLIYSFHKIFPVHSWFGPHSETLLSLRTSSRGKRGKKEHTRAIKFSLWEKREHIAIASTLTFIVHIKSSRAACLKWSIKFSICREKWLVTLMRRKQHPYIQKRTNKRQIMRGRDFHWILNRMNEWMNE